jgi:hypothetical protein
MATAVLPAATASAATFRAAALTREPPDTALAGRFEGEPMVQSFRVPLPDGGAGRCWITTTAALRAERFGRAWVAAALERRVASDGLDAVCAELASERGLRLDP